MTTIYFPDPRVRQRFYEGPLAICIDAFAERTSDYAEFEKTQSPRTTASIGTLGIIRNPE